MRRWGLDNVSQVSQGKPAGRGRKWSVTAIDDGRAELRQSLEKAATQPADRLRICLQVVAKAPTEDVDSLLEKLLHILVALEIHQTHGGLDRKTVLDLVQAGMHILQIAGGHAGNAKLAALRTEIRRPVADTLINHGQHVAALWEINTWLQVARAANVTVSRTVDQSASALRLGLPHLAQQYLHLLSEEELDSDAHLIRARCARFLGKWDLAHADLDAACLKAVVPAEVDWKISWEEVLLELWCYGDPQPLITLVANDGRALGARQTLAAWFLARCMPTMEIARRLPSLRTIRGRHAGDEGKDGPTSLLFRCAHRYDQCCDIERPLDLRLESLMALSEDAERTGSLDEEIFVKCAIVRCLLRYNQMDLATYCLEEYRARSRQWSSGRTDDVLGLYKEISVQALLTRYRRSEDGTSASAQPAEIDRNRAPGLTKTLFSVVGLLAKGRWQKVGTDSKQVGDIERTTRRAVVNALGNYVRHCRGPFVRLGQMCSYFEGLADDETPLGREMDGCPVSAETIRSIVQRDLGGPPEEIFGEWCAEAFEVGNTGQIHLARLHSGRRVFVKVQYPDIAEVVQAAFLRFGAVANLLGNQFPAADVALLMQDTRRQIDEELDYTRERANLESLARALSTDSSVVIPAVFPEFCSRRILTTEYIEGQSFSEFIESADQAERDSAGKILARLASRCSVDLGLILMDARPRSFVFLPSKVAMVDFPCVRQLSPEMLNVHHEYVRAVLTGNWEEVARCWIQLGWVTESDVPNLETVKQMALQSHQHLLLEGAHPIDRDCVRRIYCTYTDHPSSRHFRFPPDLIWKSRFDYGILGMVSEMGARVDWREIMVSMVFGPVPNPASCKAPEAGSDAA